MTMFIPSSRRWGRSATTWWRRGATSASRRWRASFSEGKKIRVQCRPWISVWFSEHKVKSFWQKCSKCLTLERYPCVASVGRGYDFVSSWPHHFWHLVLHSVSWAPRLLRRKTQYLKPKTQRASTTWFYYIHNYMLRGKNTKVGVRHSFKSPWDDESKMTWTDLVKKRGLSMWEDRTGIKTLITWRWLSVLPAILTPLLHRICCCPFLIFILLWNVEQWVSHQCKQSQGKRPVPWKSYR